MKIFSLKEGKDLKEMVSLLSHFPDPSEWTSTQKAQAIHFAALLDTAQQMIAIKKREGIDWSSEQKTFLTYAGRSNSPYTRKGYRSGLSRLEQWSERQHLHPLELTPSQADDFIYALRSDGRASSSVRLDIAAASSFYTWLERRHEGVQNPFRGTKSRPAVKMTRKIIVPDAREVKMILRSCPADLVAAIAVMAYRGLRAGALPLLQIQRGGKFESYSKGKEIRGTLDPLILKFIQHADLSLDHPFAGLLPNTLEKRVSRALTSLYRSGKIKHSYSCHDFRHFYAITEYQKDHDLYRVKTLLGHASLSITERYLQSLGEMER